MQGKKIFSSNIKKITLTSLFIACLLLPLFILSANSAIVETVTVPIRGVNGLAINLKQGEKAVGSFSISGYSIIGFEINDPIGESVVDYNVVDTGTTFEILANRDGAYTLSFTNNSNHYESVISVSYNIESSVFGTLPLMWFGVIIVILLIGLGVLVYWRRSKNKR
jgi:hypothetical protein